LVDFVVWVEQFKERAYGYARASAVQPAQQALELPRGGIMPTDEPLGADGMTEDSPARILHDLLEDIRYEDWLWDTLDAKPTSKRWQHVQELVDWLGNKARQESMNLPELAQHVALITMLERQDEDDPDAVRLSTLHASKGLEYPHVYLICVEEGMLPHAGQGGEDSDIDQLEELEQLRIQEERRLMYVGITRAQRSLHISWCERRRRGREEVCCEPSRFIAEMKLDASRVDEVDDY